MISFIIIGKNVQNTIRSCVESVLVFIDLNDVENFEIIYIDSNSTDDTLKLALELPIKIYLISGKVNSAVARNVGAGKAKGEILFFLDGDMELLPGFFSSIFQISTGNSYTLKYPFNNGYMKEIYYDSGFNFLFELDEQLEAEPQYQHVTGGLMVLEKKLWERAGGMDERLIRSQDLDLGLRLSSMGFPVLKDNHYWIIHHTCSYQEKGRLTYFMGTKALLSTGILMRKHILNAHYFKHSRNHIFYSLFILLSFILVFVNPLWGLLLFLTYISFQAMRSAFKIKSKEYFIRSFLYNTFYNLYSLSGFLFYFPESPFYKVVSKKE